MRTLHLLLTALIAALALPAWAGAAETLVMAPYPGPPAWKEVTNQRKGPLFLREQIPADQALEDYRDMLVAQALPAPPGMTPAQFLRGVFARAGGHCSGVRVNGPVERTEGGYAVAYGQLYCGQQIGQPFGVNIFYKVIRGREVMYVVNRDFRVPPSAAGGVQTFSANDLEKVKAQIAAQGAANDYLVKGVRVCEGASCR